jgi:hypothetical protein
VALLVLVGVFAAQLAWVVGVPPFRGIDEFDHAFRAASVALGDVRPAQLPADDGRGAIGEVPPALAADAKGQCESLDYTRDSNCNPVETLPNGNARIASSAAAYSPVYYVVVGTIARPWDGAAALYVMRLASSLINALMIALAAWCLLRRSRTGWPLTGFLVGLTPMAVYTSMLPAPNGLELSAALVLWCALLALQQSDEKYHGRLLAAVGGAGLILGSVRQTGPVFIVLILAVCLLTAPRRSLAVVRRHRVGVAAAGVLTVAGGVYQLHWMLTRPPVAVLDASSVRDVAMVVKQPALWIFQWIGAFPFRDQPTSLVTYAACGTAITLLLVLGLRRGGRNGWLAGGVVTLSLLVPLAFTWLTYAELGPFWQGRYALPFLLGTTILMGLALDTADRQVRRSDRVLQQLMVLLMAAGGAAAVIDTVNKESLRAVSASDPHWLQPGPVVILLLAAVNGICLSRAVARADTGSTSEAGASSATPAAGLRPPTGAAEVQEGRLVETSGSDRLPT